MDDGVQSQPLDLSRNLPENSDHPLDLSRRNISNTIQGTYYIKKGCKIRY